MSLKKGCSLNVRVSFTKSYVFFLCLVGFGGSKAQLKS